MYTIINSFLSRYIIHLYYKKGYPKNTINLPLDFDNKNDNTRTEYT